MRGMTRWTSVDRSPLLLSLLAAVFVVGCVEDGLEPMGVDDSTPDAQFTTVLDLNDLAAAAATAPVRIEVELFPDGPPWVARELELEVESEVSSEEKIESSIAAADEAAGTVTLVFGDLVIEAATDARFRTENSSNVSKEEFFDRVFAALDAGVQPGVELRRAPPENPQAPDDPSFVATDLRLDDEADEPEVKINIDGRHLSVDDAESGVLTILGVEILLDADAGGEFEKREDGAAGAVEIEGLVASVADNSVTLLDGRIVRLVEGTKFKTSGKDGHLNSLAEVAAALDVDLLVEMEAEAILESEGVYIAIEIEFEVEDSADDVPGATEFEGRVAEVAVVAGTLTLEGGLALTITDRTVFDDDGDLLSLEEIADALAAEQQVEVEGHYVVDVDAATGLTVLEIEAEIDDDDDDDVDFEGTIASVDLADGTFTLEGGLVLTVTAETTFDADGDLLSLQEMADAIAAETEVEAEGEATLNGETGEREVRDVKVETKS